MPRYQYSDSPDPSQTIITYGGIFRTSGLTFTAVKTSFALAVLPWFIAFFIYVQDLSGFWNMRYVLLRWSIGLASIPWIILGGARLMVVIGAAYRDVSEYWSFAPPPREPYPQPPVKEIIRPIPVYGGKSASRLPVNDFALPDGRAVTSQKAIDFITSTIATNDLTLEKSGLLGWEREDWDAMLKLLTSVGLIEPKSQGKAARWRTQDVHEALTHLRLTHPTALPAGDVP